MKSEKNIFIAFLLNLFFSLLELIGGIFTGSVSIISDALHDMGDAISIGIAFLFERKSKKPPDEKYTYGYIGYSIIGSVITTLILLFGSVAVIFNAIDKLINPTKINFNGMIFLALIGVLISITATVFTRGGDSLNQKAVNLHMLEDTLGWVAVLIGAIIMKFTDLSIIDPLISICVAAFIFINAIKNLKSAFLLFLNKAPNNIDINIICERLSHINGVLDVHHIHVWSMDGHNNYATMHIVADGDYYNVKQSIKKELHALGIGHVTIELESENEYCGDKHCHLEISHSHSHSHHHH